MTADPGALDSAALLPGVLAGAAAVVLAGRSGSAPRRLSQLRCGAAAGPRATGPLRRWCPAGLAVGRRMRTAALQTAADQRERARAVEAAAALAAELRAGRPPHAALAVAARVAVGRTAQALATAASTAAAGGDAAAVLTREAPTTPVPALLRGLAACWTLCSRTGSALAGAVERLEQAERDAEDRRRAVQAELAGPRATARMLAALPVVGLLLAAGLGADPLHVLLGTSLGRACLAAGVTLDLLGLLWTRRLVARASSS